ncbi:universal stress protein [Streptomyces sp. NPDC001070]
MDEVGEECVVVGVSGSPGSLAALRRAAAEARRRRAVLTVVTAWEATAVEGVAQPVAAGPARAGPVAQPRPPPIAHRPGRRLRRRSPSGPASAAGPRTRPGGARAGRGRRHRGGPARGSGGVLRRVLGPSVADHCFAHAKCPVLGVPPEPGEPGAARGRGAGRRSGARRRPPGFVTP